MAESFFDRVHKQDTHTPDVLACLANLSNDEVFTPPEVVNQMLDMLPKELFESTETTFLDPACKTGVFLREIAKRLLNNQVPLYKEKMELISEKKSLGIPLKPEDEEFMEMLQAAIDHIFHKQLFGIAITELTSLLSRRSVYCSKYPNGQYSVSRFDNPEGNIRFRKVQHTWVNGKCKYCGASQSEYDRSPDKETHAYEFIHMINLQEAFKMPFFDVIIGNPPYQLNDGGSGNGISAIPIYQKFVTTAKKLKPKYISMIIPSRWFAGGKGLDEFRFDMLNDDRLHTIVDYVNSADCFAGVDIAGGINYFLWDKDYHGTCTVTTVRGASRVVADRKLNEFDIFVRSNESLSIIEKIISSGDSLMDRFAFTRNPFGFESKKRGNVTKDSAHPITLVHSQGKGYVALSEVTKNIDAVSKWKVSIGKLVPSNGEVGIDPSKGYNAITQPRVLKSNEVITDSYLVLGAFDTELEAVNCSKYMTNKLPRFLMHETYSSMNISKGNFRFVPFLNFKKEWSDEELYQRYKLTDDEISFIESMIRPMEID